MNRCSRYLPTMKPKKVTQWLLGVNLLAVALLACGSDPATNATGPVTSLCSGDAQGCDGRVAANGGAGDGSDDGGSDDGGVGDAKKGSQLEQSDILTLTKSEPATHGPEAQLINFEFSSASYSGVTKILQITGDQGLNKLELQLAPLKPGATGQFSALEAQTEDSKILMNKGKFFYTQGNFDIKRSN